MGLNDEKEKARQAITWLAADPQYDLYEHRKCAEEYIMSLVEDCQRFVKDCQQYRESLERIVRLYTRWVQGCPAATILDCILDEADKALDRK